MHLEFYKPFAACFVHEKSVGFRDDIHVHLFANNCIWLNGGVFHCKVRILKVVEAHRIYVLNR